MRDFSAVLLIGLRDYGTAQWEGGSDECDHQQESIRIRRNLAEAANASDGGNRKAENRLDKDALTLPYRHTCGKCGARRIDRQIGLEQTPDEYVAQMVSVFREVRRVLRDDGTLWLNLGDSYGGPAGNNQGGMSAIGGGQKTRNGAIFNGRKCADGTRAKDLIGIPWRVAFALQADGWYLRQDIIWHKPNPMPESVKDRCTKAHEYIFLLSKSAKYWYDAESVMEPFADERNGNPGGGGQYAVDAFQLLGTQRGLSKGKWNDDGSKKGRNRRSVWTVSTKPYSEAHFATFPPDLIEPCILAGCPEGGTVLDPFGGSGTTAMVALKHGRNAILCELNPKYIELMHERCGNVTPAANLPLFEGAEAVA